MIQPSIVDIELTNLCNLACGFCLRHDMTRPKGTMDLELFKNIIDELAGFDFPTWGKVIIAGFGEPTLHPRFTEAVAYATSTGLPLRIYTNATGLNTTIVHALLHPGVQALKLSINAHGAEMSTRVTGRRISWEGFVEGIVLLMRERIARDNGPQITLQLLSTAQLSAAVRKREMAVLNTPQMALQAIKYWQAQSLKLAKETGVPSMVAPVKESDIRVGKVIDLFETIKLKMCPYLPYRTHFDATRDFPSGLDFGSCARHFNNLVIFWDGACTPCCTDVDCHMYLGNVNLSSVKEVFNACAAVENRRKWSAGQIPSELCQICLSEGA